jgi:uncharacterized membrane protein YkvA (DUF1232 family)
MTAAGIDPRYLEMFPQWLRSLGEDAAAVGDILAESAGDDAATRSLVAGVQYIFKTLDLIPDGVDDLGYMDDAFVLRVACALAVAARPDLKRGVIERLTDDARAVQSFLEADYVRLESYVEGLCKGAARGRTTDEIARSAEARKAFLTDVRQWSAAYQAPSFTRDPKTLIKLRAFLNTKLP